MAFYNIHPFGEERADLRMGIQASLLANVNSGKGKRYTPKDFIPDFSGEPKGQSAEEMQSFFKALGSK